MLWPLLWGAPGVLLGFWAVVLLPKFREIFLDLTGGSLPLLLEWLSRYRGIIGASLMAIILTVLLAVASYAFGPYLHGAFGRWGNRWLLGLPWQRQRVQRDFVALQAVDDAGELHWRLENAVRGGGGFPTTLAGWQESPGGRAFQSEQTMAPWLTTIYIGVAV